MNTPAILEDEQVCRHLLEVEQIRKVFERLRKATIALVGVGNLQNSVFRERNALTSADIEKLVRRGAVGEIVGRFYNADGQECDTPYRKRVVGVDLATLSRMKRVVGVVAGSDRTDAIIAAVRGGILNSLVIDDVAANALIDAAT